MKFQKSVTFWIGPAPAAAPETAPTATAEPVAQVPSVAPEPITPSETSSESSPQAPTAPPAQTGAAALALQTEIDPPGGDDTGVPANFEDMVALFAANGEPLLHAYLVNNVHLVKFEIGKISLRVSDEGPRDLLQSLSRCLNNWTGRAWFIEASDEGGVATLQQQRDAEVEARRQTAISHPLVQQALAAFPGAKVDEVRPVADRDLLSPAQAAARPGRQPCAYRGQTPCPKLLTRSSSGSSSC